MKLILHAGTHKTGTTSIQRALADNRARLRSQGLVYPDGTVPFGRTRVPHHMFAHALTESDPSGRRNAEVFLDAARRTASVGDTILISAEPIYRHIAAQDPSNPECDYWSLRRRYLESLAKVLGGYDVRVLLYFRERASCAESLYAERVRKGTQRTFPEFLAAYEQWFDYDRQLELFRDIFRDVQVESYESARGAGLVGAFFQAIGFAAPPGVENIWQRRSAESEKRHFSSAEERLAFMAKYDRPSSRAVPAGGEPALAVPVRG